MEAYAHLFLRKKIAVTGVQRKLSLHLDHRATDRFTIVGALGGNYILKPPSPEFSFLPELEDLTMHLAAVVGISTAKHSLVEMSDGKIAYITKRFDRENHHKIPQEDACQLSELLTENKYRSSHEKLGQVITKFSSFPGDDVLRIFEITLFSFLTGNADMHLKNFSLSRNDKGHYRLTPAYDLVPTRLLLSEREDPEELALHLNGKKSRLKRQDFIDYGSYLKVPDKVVKMTLNKLASSMPKMLKWIEISFLSEELKTSYKQLITDRWHRLSDS